MSDDYIMLDMSPRGQILGGMQAQAANDQEAEAFRAFCDALTDKQLEQLLALDGFTEPYKIPIWDDEIGGPAHDANRKRARKPDRYLDATTAPRDIIDDLVVLVVCASLSMERVKELADTYSRLDKVNPEYWQHVVEILGKPQHGILQNSFLPILTGNATSAITEAALKNGILEENDLVIKTPSGTLRIVDVAELLGGCGTSAKKLFDTARVYLTHINYYKGSEPRQTVEISLTDYWHATKDDDMPMTADNLKDLKRSIKKDLIDLEKIRVDFTERSKDYVRFPFISSHSIIRDRIIINFDIQAAKYLINAHMGQWPTALLRHDNKNPNSYAIGAKIALHNNMYNNMASGTANTLSVKTLLKAAPEIPTIEELKKRNARNWKDKIKRPLETSLDNNTKPPVSYLARWEYRDPTTGKTYTKKEAQTLTWEAYYNLMIDFVVASEPDGQKKRMIEYSAKKEEQAKRAGAEKKKRGRPKKNKGEPKEQMGGTQGTNGGNPRNKWGEPKEHKGETQGT